LKGKERRGNVFGGKKRFLSSAPYIYVYTAVFLHDTLFHPEDRGNRSLQNIVTYNTLPS
jgi:hypothetical protein